MDANVIDRIKRFLYENGYSAGKGDIDWILDQMSEELEYQAEENGGICTETAHMRGNNKGKRS